MDECRVAFEKYWDEIEMPQNSQSWNSIVRDDDNSNDYLMRYTHRMWEIWQAAWNASHDRCGNIARSKIPNITMDEYIYSEEENKRLMERERGKCLEIVEAIQKDKEGLCQQ